MLQWIFIVGTIFVPVWACLIWLLPLNGRKWLILTETCLAITTIWLVFNPINMLKVTSWMQYYTFFLMIYIILISHKLGFQNFNKVLAISMLMVFIAADYWEIPVFVYGSLGAFDGKYADWAGAWHDHIHRIYVLASCYLLFKLTDLTFEKWHLSLFLLGVLASFLLLSPLGSIIPRPTTWARLVCLSCFGMIVYSAFKQIT